MKKKDIVFGVIWLLLGLVLTVLCSLEALDAFWSGVGSALMVVGIVRLLRSYRLSRSETYREKREVAETDERFHFIRNKAWAWAGYFFVMAGAFCSIVFKILKLDDLSVFAGSCVCLIMVLYWFSYLILHRKY